MEKSINISQAQKLQISKLETKFGKIVYLNSQKFSNSQIRQILNLTCVQHVYNELKRNQIKLEVKKLNK